MKKWDKPTTEECMSLEWFGKSKYPNMGGMPGSGTGVMQWETGGRGMGSVKGLDLRVEEFGLHSVANSEVFKQKNQWNDLIYQRHNSTVQGNEFIWAKLILSEPASALVVTDRKRLFNKHLNLPVFVVLLIL